MLQVIAYGVTYEATLEVEYQPDGLGAEIFLVRGAKFAGDGDADAVGRRDAILKIKLNSPGITMQVTPNVNQAETNLVGQGGVLDIEHYEYLGS